MRSVLLTADKDFGTLRYKNLAYLIVVSFFIVWKGTSQQRKQA